MKLWTLEEMNRESGQPDVERYPDAIRRDDLPDALKPIADYLVFWEIVDPSDMERVLSAASAEMIGNLFEVWRVHWQICDKAMETSHASARWRSAVNYLCEAVSLGKVGFEQGWVKSTHAY